MNRNKILALFSSLLIITFFASCQEEIEDNDLITGKWREESIVMNENAEECEKLSYMEFSKYDADIQKRILTNFNACDSVSTLSKYTIDGDTLIVLDDKLVTKRYTISLINETKMIYSDKNNREYIFVRYK